MFQCSKTFLSSKGICGSLGSKLTKLIDNYNEVLEKQSTVSSDKRLFVGNKIIKSKSW